MRFGRPYSVIISVYLAWVPGSAQGLSQLRPPASQDASDLQDLILRGKHEAAFNLVKNRLALARHAGQAIDALLLNCLVQLFVEVGRLSDADQTLQSIERVEGRDVEPVTLRQRSTLLLARGDFEAAATSAAKAYRVSVDRGYSSIRVAYCLSLEAQARLRLSGIAEAARLVHKAMEAVPGKVDNPPFFAPRILYASGLIKSHSGNPAEAEADCQRGLQMSEKPRADSRNGRNLSLGYLALAEVYLQAGKLAECREFSVKSLQVTQRLFGLRHQDMVRALELLALADLREGKVADARTRAEDAVRIAKVVFGEGSPGLRGPNGTLEQVLKAAESK